MSRIRHSGNSQTIVLPVDVEAKTPLITGVGDCEDYVLAKYLVLLDARFPDKDLRILLVRDNFVRADHAILAAKVSARRRCGEFRPI